MAKGDVKKVVLAYSGGLDTSIILKWLQTTYGCEVVTFTADLGQGEELEPAREKALLLGIKPENIFIEDLREEFVRDYVFPMFRANALYEGHYLLGTSIARPLIAKKQIEIAEKVGADAVAHGATGKGNDQVRFELAYYALKPDVKVIAPWREWDLDLAHAADRVRRAAPDPDRQGQARRGAVLGRCQPAARLLGGQGAGGSRRRKCRTTSIRAPSTRKTRPTRPTYITVGFERGDAVAIDGKTLSPAALLARLNELGRANGIGRLDLVENRFVGMKSRGMYETPGGTILHAAHRGIESDHARPRRRASQGRADAEICRAGLQRLLVRARARDAAGRDRPQPGIRDRRGAAQALQGQVGVVGRESPYSLYDQDLVTFEEGAVAYDHRDAAGFIRLNALRLRTLGQRKKKLKL